MCARCIASRNSGSSAASIVICVKNTMSSGSCASGSISSKRSARIAFELVELRRVRAARGHAQVFERDRIEVVVGERDEAEAAPAQLDDLVDHRVDVALRGFWPSVRHTEQNEQCFGQPRTVCTDAHM